MTDAEIGKFSRHCATTLRLQKKTSMAKAISKRLLAVFILACLSSPDCGALNNFQLKWSDIEDNLGYRKEGRRNELIKIKVRGETSTVRQTRRFIVKDSAKYFEGLMKLQIKFFELGKVLESMRLSTLGDRIVFSTNGETPITPRFIGYHFDKIIEMAKINSKERDLVPYSFRHYFITKRVNTNVPIASIAEMCGTSISQRPTTTRPRTRWSAMRSLITST